MLLLLKYKNTLTQELITYTLNTVKEKLIETNKDVQLLKFN